MKYILIIFVIAVVVGSAFYLRSGTPSASPTPTASATPRASPKASQGTATPTPRPSSGLIVNEVSIHEVDIQGFAFNPATTTVKRGDVVIFTNRDSTVHTVTSDTGIFDSGNMSTGVEWTLQTANVLPGTYAFHCGPHPFMKGIVIIQ